MPQRRVLYDPHQTSALSKTKEPQQLTSLAAAVSEPASPEYDIKPAWIDTAGRTRTWALRDPHGTQVAEITTKTAASKLAALLNRVMDNERGPAR